MRAVFEAVEKAPKRKQFKKRCESTVFTHNIKRIWRNTCESAGFTPV